MKAIIIDKLTNAIAALQAQNIWPQFSLPPIDVTCPAHRTQGDYATGLAMKLAKLVQRSPLDIGADLKAQLDMTGLEKIEVVQPGFINFFVNEEFVSGGLRFILEQKEKFGQAQPKNKTVLVEFLSANPTGPLHLGNGRGGFTGDAIAQVLRLAGYKVIAEYYINDFGKQTDTLAESVLRRYLQEQGIKIDYPDELYRGDYIVDLAKQVQLPDIKLGDQTALVKMREQIKEWALQKMIEQIKTFVTDRLHIQYDVWKSERSLLTPKNRKRAVDFLQSHDLIYSKEGATFFASSRFGDDKDRVIIKSDGETTYFFSDILYLLDKYEDRKIDQWVWLLGADHHGYKARTEAALQAIGHRGTMDVIFVQLVRLMFNGQELRMSKRKGTFVTLEELVDEVGLDVVRWFFLMYDPNTHMDFDLNLAREQSEHNPVFYVQYAHARIVSVLNKIGHFKPTPITLVAAAEEDLAKILFQWPDLILDISQTHHVHKLTHYATEVARTFHRFYSSQRVIDMDGEVNLSRAQLIQATQIVLQNVLRAMGITAPTKM